MQTAGATCRERSVLVRDTGYDHMCRALQPGSRDSESQDKEADHQLTVNVIVTVIASSLLSIHVEYQL